MFNGLNKIFLAFTQIFAIYVFTRLFDQSEVTILFLLLGYFIWFQLFELGLPQTLQNKFNTKQISYSDFFSLCVIHLFLIMTLSISFYYFSLYEKFLIPSHKNFTIDLIKSFSLGASILILSSNNLLLQRLLMILNKDILINVFQFFQTALSIIGLLVCNYFEINNLNIVIFIYFFPLILVNIISLIQVKYSFDLKFIFILNYRECGILKQTFYFWLIGILSGLYIGMDYFFAAHFLNHSQINSYHIYSRIFFISFIFYYAYILYSSKNISKNNLNKQIKKIKHITKVSIFIGCLVVISMFVITLIFDYLGLIIWVTNGIEIKISILFFAFIYYLIRVFRDVILVIMKCINHIKNLLIIHIIEIFFVIILLNNLIPLYGLKGIFISFSMSSFIGLIFLCFYYRK